MVILSIYGTQANGWDANIIVKWLHRCPGWPLHKSLRILSNTLGLWWEMGWESVFGKICGGGINLCVLNSHVYLGLSQLKTFLFHQFLASLIFSLGTFNFCCSLSNFEIGDLERLMSSLTLLYLSLSIPDART